MFLDLQNILDAHFSSLDLNSSQINQVFNLFYSFTIGSALTLALQDYMQSRQDPGKVLVYDTAGNEVCFLG